MFSKGEFVYFSSNKTDSTIKYLFCISKVVEALLSFLFLTKSVLQHFCSLYNFVSMCQLTVHWNSLFCLGRFLTEVK